MRIAIAHLTRLDFGHEVMASVMDTHLGPRDPMELADGLDPSPLVPRLPALRDMAAPFRPADALDAFDAVRRMTEMIYHDFAYRQGVTGVHTSVAQIVEDRQGVCQDFAHL